MLFLILCVPLDPVCSANVLKVGERMRVLCEGLDGSNVEGEVIGGDFIDVSTGLVDLDATFTVRCDDGACFAVHGWLVDVEVLDGETQRAE
jgi:hypothetical protein